MNTESIRRLIHDNPRTSEGYEQHVRTAVGRFVQQQRDRGVPWSKLERDLGISSTSMRTWMEALPSAGFQQIVVVEDLPARDPVSALVITSPAGFTLTGCTFEQATALLQSLR